MHPNVSLTKQTLAAPSHPKNRITQSTLYERMKIINAVKFFSKMPVKFTFICRTSSGTVSPFSIDRVAEVMCLKNQKHVITFDLNKHLGKEFSWKVKSWDLLYFIVWNQMQTLT